MAVGRSYLGVWTAFVRTVNFRCPVKGRFPVSLGQKAGVFFLLVCSLVFTGPESVCGKGELNPQPTGCTIGPNTTSRKAGASIQPKLPLTQGKIDYLGYKGWQDSDYIDDVYIVTAAFAWQE